jgi:hypothetical protein
LQAQAKYPAVVIASESEAIQNRKEKNWIASLALAMTELKAPPEPRSPRRRRRRHVALAPHDDLVE